VANLSPEAAAKAQAALDAAVAAVKEGGQEAVSFLLAYPPGLSESARVAFLDELGHVIADLASSIGSEFIGGSTPPQSKEKSDGRSKAKSRKRRRQ
jgi:hypothetical protein